MLKYNNCFFVEIPRTGTTTLRSMTEHTVMDEKRHITLLQFIQKHPEYVNTPFFTIVRNPFDRVASLYEHTKHFHPYLPQLQSFDHFVEWFVSDGPELTNDIIRRTQFDMLSIDGIISANYIGRFDTLEESLNIIIDKYSLPVKNSFVLSNKFKEKDYRDYYDFRTKALIGKFCEKDLDYFKYIF